jgi:hypothetical protein
MKIILGLDFALSCMAGVALRTSLLTKTITSDAKCVKWIASSIATSQPPITTMRLFLNIGNHPSQIAHAEIPFCQKISSPGRPKRLAIAPVAMMSDSVSMISSHTKILNGLLLKSTLSTVLVSILAHILMACSLIFIMS